jgi:pimeloyl-ACP methyl ester carboxylesterase
MLMRLFGLWIRLWIRLHGGRRQVVQAAGYRIVLYSIGPSDAEPWLLLHGLGATAFSWTPVLKALSRDCRLLIPELSALGGTSGPHPSIQVAESGEVLSALLQRVLPDTPVTVAGMSLGGWMAVRLVLARPDCVARLLLVDSAGWKDQDWHHVVELVRLRDLNDVERLYGALFVRIPWLLRHSRRAFLSAYTSAAVTSILESTSDQDAFDAGDLAQIAVPTGLIWAEYDGLFPPAVGESMAAALSTASPTVVSDCGHGLHWERPAALVQAVERWRESTSDPRVDLASPGIGRIL